MSVIQRREFLKQSIAASTVFATPFIVPDTCFGANERVTVGAIGVRNQGKGNLKRFQSAGCNIGAVCDVDSHVLADAMKLVKGGQPKGYEDYRELLERKDLDAVVVTTPDHWHALISIHACQSGKDVYCEKPLTLTIAEGRRMVDAARENKRIVQTGSQQRSSKEFHTACTLVRNGAIGKIQKVLVGINTPNHPGSIGKATDPPSNLNYDMWIGPAKMVPYHEKRVHYNFRFWWDYSGGQMTNWGAHHLDITQWGLGRDDSGPVKSEGQATFHPEKLHEVTETCRITHTYDDGVEVVVGQKQDDIPGGTTFIGTEGRIWVNRGKLKSDPEDIIKMDISSLPTQLYRSTNHTENFLNCIKSRELPICDVEIGHRSATVCHLGNIVARLGRGIEWDPKSERIIGDDEAQAMTDRDYRSPWSHDMRFARS